MVPATISTAKRPPEGIIPPKSTGKTQPLRVGVIGVGYFGCFHAAKYAALPGCELTAVVDIAPARAAAAADRFGATPHTDLESALAEVDAVSVATPTASHYAVAAACLSRGVHVLLEKPMTRTLAEADALLALAERMGCLLQIGHQERFFAARLDLAAMCPAPEQITCARLGPFTGRSVDCSVVTDLMIHDIDFVQSLIPASLCDIEAMGTPQVTAYADTVDALLSYANGTRVDLSASRIHDHRERTARIVNRDGSRVDVDFLERTCTHDRWGAMPARSPAAFDLPGVAGAPAPEDNLGQELAAFAATVRAGGTPMVTGADGRRALETALAVERRLALPLRAASAQG